MTRSQAVAADVAALLRARNPLLWVVTREEARVEAHLAEAAAAAGYVARTWDVAAGIAEIGGTAWRQARDPGEALTEIEERAQGSVKERGVWIMRDLPPWITGVQGITTCRQVRNLARMLPGVPRDNAQALVVTWHSHKG